MATYLNTVTYLQKSNSVSYRKRITINVTQNVSQAGYFYFYINSHCYRIDCDSQWGVGEHTVYNLYESLKKQLDVYYKVIRNGNFIYIDNIFAEPTVSASIDGNSTGIVATVTICDTSYYKAYLQDTSTSNQTIIVNDEFDFGGDEFEIPGNCVLLFQNGCIINAQIIYNDTKLSDGYNIVNCICSGKLVNKDVTPEMFSARTHNFPSTKYDISTPIQNLLNSGNFSIVINNDDDARYEWRNTVNLFDPQNPDTDWNVCIKGSHSSPIVRKGSRYTDYTITIYTETAFRCTNQAFHFSNVNWPCVYMSNLRFLFAYSLQNTTFIYGILSWSKLDGLIVGNCYRFIHGGLKVTSLVTNCFAEINEYAFGGYLIDSKIENCYFTAGRQNEDIEPAFYMNSIYFDHDGAETDHDKHVIGSLSATIFSNNYIDYFYTIFVMPYIWDNCILTQGNIFDIFKYYAQCKYWVGDTILDKSNIYGCVICSNGDTFRRCNNFPITHPHSTDKHLKDRMSKIPNVNPRKITQVGNKYEIEIYSILGKIMHRSAFQINSFIDQTNQFVFAKTNVEKDSPTSEITDADAKFTTAPSFAFEADKDVHSGEFICGGRPSMYPFSHLSSSTDYLVNNARFRRPTLHDLQDVTVTALPTEQLFNGRRVIYNNEICTFRQNDARATSGDWVNTTGVVRGTVS